MPRRPASDTSRTSSSVDLVDWRPEDQAFWKGHRQPQPVDLHPQPAVRLRHVADVGIITVQMANAGFPFAPTSSSRSPRSPACQAPPRASRPPSSSRICGGRNTVWLTTALLMIPAVHRHRAAGQDHAAVVVPAHGAAVGHGRRQLRLLDGQHRPSSPSACGPRSAWNAGLGNFGVTTCAAADPAVDDHGGVRRLGGDAIPLVRIPPR